MMSTNRVAVIMPGYNVSRTVAGALLAIEPLMGAGIDEVIFIDNKSRDETLDVVGTIQRENQRLGSRLTVIRNGRNHGVGGSLKIGMAYVLQHGFTHFMFLHSDDQGDNLQIASAFLEQIRLRPEMDVVLASRFHAQARVDDYSLIRRLGNLYFNLLIHITTGVNQTDSGTGITCMRTRALQDVAFPGLSSGLYFNPMLNIHLLRDRKRQCSEVPLHWADSSIGSTVVPWRHVWDMTTLLLGYGVRRLLGRPGFPGEQVLRGDWLTDYPHAVERCRDSSGGVV